MNTKKQSLYTCLYVASVALLVLLQCCQLEWSGFVFFADRVNTKLVLGRPFLYYVLSAGAVALPTLLLKIAGGGYRVAGSITCVLYTALSIANYYVIDLHGSPLYPDEFLNTKTAFQVLSGYELTLPKKMLTLLLFTVAELVLLWGIVPRLQRRAAHGFRQRRLRWWFWLLSGSLMGRSARKWKIISASRPGRPRWKAAAIRLHL